MKRRRVRRRPRPRVDEAEALSHRLFQEAAQKQRCCAVCNGARGGWHPHHVVYAQHLKAEGHPIYDARNALRLCPDCHAAHHARSKVIPLRKLLDIHFEYAFEKLGVRAYDYLRRLYDGEDARLEHWLKRTEDGDDERIASGAAPL